MVPFGGFEMPVQYNDLSVGESHKWTREKASIFDVSHMVQYHFEGPGVTDFLESLTPSSLSTLPPHQSTLSALLHPETGGIVDDTVITRLTPEKFYVVTNAGCRDKDWAFLSSALSAWQSSSKPPLTITPLQDQGLIALQGPLSASILSSVLADPTSLDLQSFYFGSSHYITVQLPNGPSEPLLAARGGYTGEDGFEISIPPHQTAAVTDLLLSKAGPDKIRLAGLGARDSLRLEAGMCLYGHDLDDTTTPVEAGLSWIIGKSRRESGTFNGSETVLGQLVPASKGGKGVTRRRIGLIVEGAPAREGADIVNAEGTKVGVVTSGCPSPSLGKNIAMGYVKNGLHKAGTELLVRVRGKDRKAIVTKMPFLPSKYWKGGASPS
ncbi:glycine cleavage system T protein [Sphaceloma murrayae]|uniref:Aminomethyltransferase n=1 Tax=Sphaceloma murrayae TaxID=2082308 RepID=A0A2K1QY17_9PEZI|nr:glycine cleavage system T protein [Sphaceloma murrayae]